MSLDYWGARTQVCEHCGHEIATVVLPRNAGTLIELTARGDVWIDGIRMTPAKVKSLIEEHSS